MRHVRHATVRLLRGGFVFVRVGVGLRVGQYRRRLRLLGHRQCFRGHLDGGRLRFPETYGSFEDLGKRRAREQGDRWSRENPNRSTVIARHRRFCCDKKSHTMHAYPANAGQAAATMILHRASNEIERGHDVIYSERRRTDDNVVTCIVWLNYEPRLLM